MRVLIITQDDPFYLTDSLSHLIKNFPPHSQIIACCVLEVSPFGKKETFIEKAWRTFKIFGLDFFIHYTFKFIIQKIFFRRHLTNLLKDENIPVIRLNKGINHPESLGILGSYSPDLLISVASNQIFKRPLIDLAPKGCINLHTSLLPKYRGLLPTFWVMKNNEKETGVSVFFVDDGIDSGPIIVQTKVVIGNRSQEELIRHTKQVGMDAIISAIDIIKKGDYELIENDISKQSYFSFPSSADVKTFLDLGKRFF
jgi:methionyl-tRNA formyltransferase